MNFKEAISHKKAAIASLAQAPLEALANTCAEVWPDADMLDEVLKQGFNHVPHCNQLYTLDPQCFQVSSNISKHGIDQHKRGGDLATRPSMGGALPYAGFILSSSYLCESDKSPCITALHAINRNDELLGFLLADFRVYDLPLDNSPAYMAPAWKQFKGDPTIRSSLFSQKRAETLMDEQMGNVFGVIKTLMQNHGVFHTKLLFSSSRATLWMLDDPYSYRLHEVSELVNPEACLAYPRHDYPDNAKVNPEQIHEVLAHFMALRFADENIYLRSGSLNIMNGMVGLTFSCDGSHYFPVNEFIDKDFSFWLGSYTTSEAASSLHQ